MKKVVGRNAPCPCGSGFKFKRCCLKSPPEPILPLLAGPELHVIGNRVVRGHSRAATDETQIITEQRKP